MSYKYTDEMVAKMKDTLSAGATRELITKLASDFEFPERSVSAKARSLGFEVPKSDKGPVFTAEETEAFRAFVTSNSGQMTAEEISKAFAGGKFEARQVSGKALALELTSHVKPAEKKVAVKTYTDAEEATIRSMVADGKALEDIAEALGKSVNSVRGKLLSMELKAPQKVKKEAKGSSYEGIETLAPTMTVDQLVEHFSKATGTTKTARGVKTVLTRKGVNAKDYNAKTKA